MYKKSELKKMSDGELRQLMNEQRNGVPTWDSIHAGEVLHTRQKKEAESQNMFWDVSPHSEWRDEPEDWREGWEA